MLSQLLEQLLNCAVGSRMEKVWSDLGERCQDEAACVHLRMGQGEGLGCKGGGAVEEEIEVEGPRAVGYTAGAVAAEALFDLKESA